MLNFAEELEKFKPILGIETLEEQITTEDLRDVMDLIKEGIGSKKERNTGKNESGYKEQ